ANLIGSGLLIVIVLAGNFIPSIPRSIFILDFGLSMVLLPGIRIGIRLFYSHIKSGKLRTGKPRGRKNLLIIGAGSAGDQLLREIHYNPLVNYNVVGFLDDDPQKQKARIRGIPVLSTIDGLPGLKVLFDEILIAIPTADSSRMRRIVNLCKETGKPYKTVPGISEIINGKVNFSSVRDVSITDIIGREEVNLDAGSIERFLDGKRVLITGAGGSIGSELVRQCLNFTPEKIYLLDNSEFNLFTVEKETRGYNNSIQISALLADIRDREVLERVFIHYQPDVVFHAAAYKHVPIQEEHPWQAVNTNIKGTKNVGELSEQYGVEKFILVSTDKAVRPTSVMGATKRIAELMLQKNGKELKTQFMAVRFGNVIGSSGSVIPTFREQIEKGGPVTVTHPDIERYFMSIPEAAQLILQAGSLGNGGEVFVLKMGDPIKIDTVAKELIRMSGHEPNVDIPIIYTGLRPGEKMYEELITEHENHIPTQHEKIMILQSKYNQISQKTLHARVDQLFYLCTLQDRHRILKKLNDILPSYTPWNLNNEDDDGINLDIVNR
ncbi:MAG: NAD-dependent epimerase/dehydratase family protein, partial [Candidatus Marinimicrobia bacterium]|nr:NAD-dependent epimerase/dehydratase family protein [Candidatus Neomarinimicrobiota bacterium]